MRPSFHALHTRAGASDAIHPRRARRSQAVADDRRELAAHPSREGQREALLRRPVDLRRQRTLQRARRAGASRGAAADGSPSSRPDGVEQHVIDERHAHLERVRHRHDVDVAQQLRCRDTAAISSRATDACGCSGPAAVSSARSAASTSAHASRHTRGSRSAGPAIASISSGRKNPRCTRYASAIEPVARANCRQRATQPRRHHASRDRADHRPHRPGRRFIAATARGSRRNDG